jgi:glutamate racemase
MLSNHLPKVEIMLMGFIFTKAFLDICCLARLTLMTHSLPPGPIGIFDSGFGGLTVFRSIINRLPQYDYIYLGDNARVPYGTRSFETVYAYTKECIEHLLLDHQCTMVVMACNTASAKALRTIQQQDLAGYGAYKKVLGVIRPTTEQIGHFTKTGHVGIMATPGTVKSNSYPIEIAHFFPQVKVFQQACPMWVPLIENNDLDSVATKYYAERYLEELLAQSPEIDTLLLACTHYPLLLPLLQSLVPPSIQIISQGDLVADRLEDYLQRHQEIDALCSKNGHRTFLTTDDATSFEEKARLFFGEKINASHTQVGRY